MLDVVECGDEYKTLQALLNTWAPIKNPVTVGSHRWQIHSPSEILVWGRLARRPIGVLYDKRAPCKSPQKYFNKTLSSVQSVTYGSSFKINIYSTFRSMCPPSGYRYSGLVRGTWCGNEKPSADKLKRNTEYNGRRL